MRQSPVYEDKVLFNALLRENGLGTALVEAMARAGGVSNQEILMLADRAPTLEMYLPVPDHRASWDGSEEVIVATTLSEIETPFGVDLEGTEVQLSLEEAPQTVTIVLVRAESFDAAGAPRARSLKRVLGPSLNIDDCGSNAFQDCSDPGDGFGGYGVCEPVPDGPDARGIGIRERLFCVRFLNKHEPWPGGAPEFDIRLAGTEDLDSFAEVHPLRRIQNAVWDNKGEGDWAEIGLNLFDIDVDMGSRVAIQCFEDDPDDDDAYNVSGTTTFDVGPVSFEFNFEDFFGDGDDNCGGYELLLKTSTGEYTTFRQDKDGVPDGTSDLEWLTYGIDLTI